MNGLQVGGERRGKIWDLHARSGLNYHGFFSQKNLVSSIIFFLFERIKFVGNVMGLIELPLFFFFFL